MWIMIAGPYRSGSDDPQIWKANLQKLNAAAWQVFQKGHIPIIGVNMALPIIETVGEADYDAIMMPVSLALAERCDAVLRIGGASSGADQEVARFQSRDLPVYFHIDEVVSSII